MNNIIVRISELYGYSSVPDYYYIDNSFEVWNTRSAIRITQSLDCLGYRYVTLPNIYSPVPHKLRMHRLIALAFIENSERAYHLVVNHIDGNKQNNSLDNLEFCTSAENSQHAVRTGLNDYKQRIYRVGFSFEPPFEYFVEGTISEIMQQTGLTYYHIKGVMNRGDYYHNNHHISSITEIGYK